MQAIEVQPGIWEVVGGFNPYQVIKGDLGALLIEDHRGVLLRAVAGGIDNALEACEEIDQEAEREYRSAVSREVWCGHCGDKDDF